MKDFRFHDFQIFDARYWKAEIELTKVGLESDEDAAR